MAFGRSIVRRLASVRPIDCPNRLNKPNLPTAEPWIRSLRDVAERLEADWIAVRRHLHRHPELSGDERATTQYLAAATERLDLPTRVIGEGRGLTVDFVSSAELAEANRIALRGDIDALPIEDHKAVDYRSTCPGVMHACGHDVHATIVLGAIQILTTMHAEDSLPWPIATRAIFQPAEEIAEGAQYMIQHHALRGVGAILALHVDPTRTVGCIGLRAGLLTAACDIFHVEIVGKGGHGARPHQCVDPIDACTSWVQTAYRRVGRVIDPIKTVVMSVGRIEAGHSANVIPDVAHLSGSLRSLDKSSRQTALDTLHSVGRSIADQTGCEVKLRLGMSAPAVNNDGGLIRLLSDSAVQAIGPAAPDPIAHPSMGSEDFSYYLDHVPGAMFRLGVAGPQVGHEPLHTPAFDVDERCLQVGATLLAAAVIKHFAPPPSQRAS